MIEIQMTLYSLKFDVGNEIYSKFSNIAKKCKKNVNRVKNVSLVGDTAHSLWWLTVEKLCIINISKYTSDTQQLSLILALYEVLPYSKKNITIKEEERTSTSKWWRPSREIEREKKLKNNESEIMRHIKWTW